MRVEIIREPVNVNMAVLEQVGGAALDEFYRIAMNMRDCEINKFERLAADQNLVFSRGAETLSYNKTHAVVSIYLDIEDDAGAIFFKLSIEPIIRFKD